MGEGFKISASKKGIKADSMPNSSWQMGSGAFRMPKRVNKSSVHSILEIIHLGEGINGHNKNRPFHPLCTTRTYSRRYLFLVTLTQFPTVFQCNLTVPAPVLLHWKGFSRTVCQGQMSNGLRSMLETRGVHNAERCTVSFIIASIQVFDSESVCESLPWVFLLLYPVTLHFILHN